MAGVKHLLFTVILVGFCLPLLVDIPLSFLKGFHITVFLNNYSVSIPSNHLHPICLTIIINIMTLEQMIDKW